jgi:hypothetical protein
MNNNVIQFPLDPKRRVTFQIGGRKRVLIIPAIPLARRPKRAELIPIFKARNPPGGATGRSSDFGLHSLSTS